MGVSYLSRRAFTEPAGFILYQLLFPDYFINELYLWFVVFGSHDGFMGLFMFVV